MTIIHHVQQTKSIMAGLPDKLVAQVAFKAGGDVYHQLLVKKPKYLAKAIPAILQDCELHQGDFGTSGSVFLVTI